MKLVLLITTLFGVQSFAKMALISNVGCESAHSTFTVQVIVADADPISFNDEGIYIGVRAQTSKQYSLDSGGVPKLSESRKRFTVEATKTMAKIGVILSKEIQNIRTGDTVQVQPYDHSGAAILGGDRTETARCRQNYTGN